MPPDFKAYNLASGHEGGLSQMSSGPCKALLSFFGEHNQGKQVLDVIVRVALTSLVSYSGENDLQVFVQDVEKVHCLSYCDFCMFRTFNYPLRC